MPSALPRTLATVLMLVPATAFAHTGAGTAHAFTDGFAHPLDGLDHMLAMVTVGILAWQLGGRAIWLLPASFLSLMALGGTFGVAGEALPWVELGIAASVIVLGTMVALGGHAPLAVAMGTVGLFAIFHGYAHGAAMPFGASGVLYAAGFVLATAFLHVTGIALGFLIGRVGESHGRLAYRLGGGAVALAGAGFLQHGI